MKKRSAAALIAALAVVAFGILVSFFLSFSPNHTEQNTITLPGQGSATIDPNPDIAQANRDKVQAVTVDRTGVQALVASLERPEIYACKLQTTYFYEGKTAVFHSDVWHGGGLTRVSQFDGTQKPLQQALLTDRKVYLWGDGEQEYAAFSRREKDSDLYSRAPSYEDLLALPAEAILSAELREIDGYLCLHAESEDLLTGETETWNILVETGLLLSAEGRKDGHLTYAMVMLEFRPELNPEEDFLLPDGTRPD